MKKLITLILLITLSFTGYSQVTEAQAKQTARAFAEANFAAKGEALTLVSSDRVYIYNVGDNGFVMISGSTVLPPVLGYSQNEKFPDLDYAPDNYRWWIQHYKDMVDYAEAYGIQPEEDVLRQWDDALNGRFAAKNTTTVTPLITTHWNQDCYYNEYCPSTGGGWWGGPCGHAYAGCVACAMAQVMKYWNHPEVGFGSHSYVHGEYGEQYANFGATTYQWNSMPEQIYSHNDAVATLMYHCGVSVNMNYGADGSGAQSRDVETALRSYFGYCGAKYRQKSSYEHDLWIEMLKAELDLSHPLYYSGANGSSGHAFVCDGYDSNDLFHFNFGWSGSGDSQYYSLYDVNGFSEGQAAVFNIVPMDIRADENGIIYVSADGTGNGSSWANATPLLEYASYLSSGGSTKVWVKSGTYYGDDTDPVNAFNISASNKVYGGFSGNEGPGFSLSDRDLEANPTILDGQNTKRVLNQAEFFNAGSRAVWDGFIIQNGMAGAGAGVYLNDYTTLSNCIIRDNTSNGFGGGVYVNSSTGIGQTQVVNCIITGNSASMGGGLCDRNSSVITNCVISNNTATTKGGGIYLYNTDKPILKGCVVSNNTAATAGGIYARGKCQLSNCNILMNRATEATGGLFIENQYSKYTNCIIWGNEANGTQHQVTGNASFEHCAVQGGMNGEGNINLPAANDGEEPGVYVRFVRPAQGTGAEFEDADWHIEPRSICLNAGKPGPAGYTNDLDGHLRVQHGLVDLGVYELNASLTLIEDYLSSGGSYDFNGVILHEPGYYTTVYHLPEYDSVVGLNLNMPLDLEQYLETEDWDAATIQVFDLTGRRISDSIENLAPGIYLIRYLNGQAVRTKKIMVR